ncbi:hypothetical protein ACLBWZ_08865 [Brucellaceae bacterium C25G]
MKIHNVFSVTRTVDDCLMVDMDYTGTLGRGRAVYAYRASDTYSPLTPLISKWLDDNNPEILPYVVPSSPTSEEERAQMPPLTRRQLRLTLLRSGIPLAHVEACIAAMPEGLEKQEAEIEWADASQFSRLHPTLLLVVDGLNLTAEQVDKMWEYALTV